MCRELVALVSLSWGLRFGAGAPGATKASSKPKDAITPWQMDFLLGRSSHAIFCQQPPSAARVHLHQRGRTLPPALWRLDFIDKRGSMCSVDVDSIHKTCALSLSLRPLSLSLSRSLALSLSRSLALSLSLSHVFSHGRFFRPSIEISWTEGAGTRAFQIFDEAQ